VSLVGATCGADMQFRRGLADCDLMAGAYEMLTAPVVDRPDQW